MKIGQIVIKILQSKTTSYTKSLECGDCESEVMIFKKQNLFICGDGIFEYNNDLVNTNWGGAESLK